ncbi:MAG: alpha/beta fold hydrolase [Alphaproteobacteria bacterium]|nr:alpha/beta fold hydrolase [Alphaproteobacteria bacterium]
MSLHFHTSDNVRLAYYVDQFTDPWKAADTVIMIHSAMGRAERWYAMVPPFARHFRVVRFDMRGYGNSAGPPADAPLTMDRLVQDVVELMKHVGVEQAHILGQTAGGFVGQNLAIRHPDRVKSLLLFASVPGLKNTTATGWLARIAEVGLRRFLEESIGFRFDATADPGLVKWYIDEVSKNDLTHLAKFVGLMSSLDWSGELHRIVCPTFLGIPGKDETDGTRNYGAFRASIKDLTTITYPGMPHQITDFAPDRCAADALAFLRQRFPALF